MIHLERMLNSRVLIDKSLDHLIERGIVPEWFTIETHRTPFTWIYEHHAKYGVVPTVGSFEAHFPGYSLPEEEYLEPVEALVDSFIKKRRYRLTEAAASRAAVEANDGDIERAVSTLRKALEELDHSTGVVTNDLDLTEDTLRRLDWYRQISAAPGGILGLPCGFPTIDRATGGFQGEQLISLVASPKTGKTWTALQIGINVHDLEDGHSVMLLSFEMSVKELQVRHDAIRAGIPYPYLRRGGLTKAQERAYEAMLNRMEGGVPFTLTDSAEGSTLSQLAAKIDDLDRPELIIVDGIYLMIDEISGEMSTPKSMTNISRGLKKLAQRIERPILVTTQALGWKMKGNRLNTGSVGYSSATAQDSDVLIGLERDEDESVTDVRILRILESRNSPPVETRIIFDIAASNIREADQVTEANDYDDEPTGEAPW